MNQDWKHPPVDFKLPDVLEDDGWEDLFLFLKFVEMDLYEGELEIAEKVADGLQLSPEAVVDENQRERLVELIFLLHFTMNYKLI